LGALRLKRVVRHWRRLSRADRRLAIEAMSLVLVARGFLRTLPFRRTVLVFGLEEGGGVTDEEGPAPEGARAVGRVVQAVASRLPSDSTCLEQALAGSAMLRRRGMRSSIHLGVSNQEGNADLTAHAWLQCRADLVTGASESPFFTRVATFSAGPAPRQLGIDTKLEHAAYREYSTLRALGLQRELISVLRHLADDGVDEVVVLKGIPLAQRLFGSVAQREMIDIDLLVHRADTFHALESLRRMGYSPYLDMPVEMDRRHELALQRKGDHGLHQLDLHWSPFDPAFGSVDERDVWSQTELFEHQGVKCHVFNPAMTIVHLANHYASHAFDEPKVLRDFAAAWNLWSPQVGEDRLMEITVATGQRIPLVVALARAGRAGLLSAASPALHSTRASAIVWLLEHRWGRTSASRIGLRLLGSRFDRGMRWMFAAVFPPRGVMEILYGEGSDAHLAASYLIRPAEIVVKAALTRGSDRLMEFSGDSP